MFEKIQEFYTWIRKPKKTITDQIFEILIILIPIMFLVRTFIFGLYQVPTGSMETTLLVGERFFADKFTVLFKTLKRGDIISFNDPQFKYTIANSPNFLTRTNQHFKNFWENYVYGPENWTKRIIALPGEEIKGVIEDGKPVVYIKKNGATEFEKLDEPYINKYPLIATYQKEDKDHPDRNRSWDPTIDLANQPFYKMTEAEIAEGKRKAISYGQLDIEQPNTPKILISRNGKVNIDKFGPFKMGKNQYWVMGDNRLGSSDSRVWNILDGKLIHGKIVYRIWSLDTYSSWWIVDLILNPIKFWQDVRWERCMQKVK